MSQHEQAGFLKLTKTTALMIRVTTWAVQPVMRVMIASFPVQTSSPRANGVDQTLVEGGLLAFDDMEQASCVP